MPLTLRAWEFEGLKAIPVKTYLLNPDDLLFPLPPGVVVENANKVPGLFENISLYLGDRLVLTSKLSLIFLTLVKLLCRSLSTFSQ